MISAVSGCLDLYLFQVGALQRLGNKQRCWNEEVDAATRLPGLWSRSLLLTGKVGQAPEAYTGISTPKVSNFPRSVGHIELSLNPPLRHASTDAENIRHPHLL